MNTTQKHEKNVRVFYLKRADDVCEINFSDAALFSLETNSAVVI